MTRLTEEMIALRTKTSNIAMVKKLNVWGSGITDISVCKKMTGVEVLALSVNSISKLESVRGLEKLDTLYLRKNQISDLNEIVHLQTLPALRLLWLDENPFCATLGREYRETILRMLPKLKRLDDKEVSEEEVEAAFRLHGGLRALQDAVNYDDTYETEQQQYDKQHSPPPAQYHRQHQQQRQESEENLYTPTPTAQQYVQQQQQQQPQIQPQSQGSASPPELTHPPSPKYDTTPQQQNRMSYPQQNDLRSPDHENPHNVYNARYRDRGPIHPSISTQSMKEYYQSDRPPCPIQYAHSQMDLSEWDEHNAQQRRSAGTEREMIDRQAYRANGVLRENGNWDSHAKPHCQYHRRLMNRSSNLLSATLCLVKELDLASLEVVEHSVRCRINELATE